MTQAIHPTSTLVLGGTGKTGRRIGGVSGRGPPGSHRLS